MNELTLDATVENLDKVLAFVDKFLEGMDCPPKTQMQIDVAVEELFVNIAHYAYTPNQGQATIRIEAEADPTAVSITLMDRGIPYDPLAKPDPDITLSASERQIGGLGVFLTKKLTDDVRYDRRDGKNILLLIKHL